MHAQSSNFTVLAPYTIYIVTINKKKKKEKGKETKFVKFQCIHRGSKKLVDINNEEQ